METPIVIRRQAEEGREATPASCLEKPQKKSSRKKPLRAAAATVGVYQECYKLLLVFFFCCDTQLLLVCWKVTDRLFAQSPCGFPFSPAPLFQMLFLRALVCKRTHERNAKNPERPSEWCSYQVRAADHLLRPPSVTCIRRPPPTRRLCLADPPLTTRPAGQRATFPV